MLCCGGMLPPITNRTSMTTPISIANSLCLHWLPSRSNGGEERTTKVYYCFGLRPAFSCQVQTGMQESFLGAKTSKIVVRELIADDSLLEFSSGNSAKKPFSFHIQRLRLHKRGTANGYFIRCCSQIHCLRAKLHLGPWQENRVQTAISGAYQFTNADLGVFGGIKGKLNSKGTFSGTLGRLKPQETSMSQIFKFPAVQITQGSSLSSPRS